MTTCWIDTETTGIETADSGAFEIAILIYQDGKLAAEKLFHLNPLNDVIKFGEGAFRVNGVPEETIRSYPLAEKVVPEIAEFLHGYVPTDGLIFAGFSCEFDYKHIKALFVRCGYPMETYFNGRMIDVYELVKKAYGHGILPKTQNQKLETMTKALGIVHEGAHTALSDIRATRKLYETIYRMGRKVQ
jgi:DNA polymerase III epsilon subunit-like protein